MTDFFDQPTLKPILTHMFTDGHEGENARRVLIRKLKGAGIHPTDVKLVHQTGGDAHDKAMSELRAKVGEAHRRFYDEREKFAKFRGKTSFEKTQTNSQIKGLRDRQRELRAEVARLTAELETATTAQSIQPVQSDQMNITRPIALVYEELRYAKAGSQFFTGVRIANRLGQGPDPIAKSSVFAALKSLVSAGLVEQSEITTPTLYRGKRPFKSKTPKTCQARQRAEMTADQTAFAQRVEQAAVIFKDLAPG